MGRSEDREMKLMCNRNQRELVLSPQRSAGG